MALITIRFADAGGDFLTFRASVLTVEGEHLLLWDAGTEVGRVLWRRVDAVELDEEQPAVEAPSGRVKTYTVEDKRKKHPRAYAAWTAEEEQRLLAAVDLGAGLAELVGTFGRQRTALIQRLNRLGRIPPA